MAVHINGVYELETYDRNSQPLYRHECGLLHLYYVVHRAMWVIGLDVGQEVGFAVTYISGLLVESINKEWYMWDEWEKEGWTKRKEAYLYCDGKIHH